MSKKNELVNALRGHTTKVAQAIQEGDDLVSAYFDRGYNTGGSDPITDADISSTGLTASQASNIVTLFQQLKLLRDSGVTVPGDYGNTMNVSRTDF